MRSSVLEARTIFSQRKLATPLQVAEIGVCSGYNAMEMFRAFPLVDMMYLVDPYESYDDGTSHDATPELFKHVFMMTMFYRKKTCFLRYPSNFVSTFFPKGFFDFVYIDGLHLYEAVYEDCLNWYPLVKPGGILAGHDYATTHAGVKKAVDQFVTVKDVNLDVFKDSDWMVKVP